LRLLSLLRSMQMVRSICEPSWQLAHLLPFSFTPVTATQLL